MKKDYLKPDAEFLDFLLDEDIAEEGELGPSLDADEGWEIG